MTTIVENDPVVADLIRQSVPGTAAVLPTVDELARQLERDAAEHVVVLGPSVPVDHAVAITEQHRVQRPALGVVLVRPNVDTAVLARAMRAGMREVVATDDLAGLGSAVRRIHAVARALSAGGDPASSSSDGTPGGLVTVFSSKGGVGKSLVATNLGAALADLGHRVCLVDLDIDGGDLAVMLGLTPQHTLADLGGIGSGLDASAVESLLTRHSERLSVLAAPVHLGAEVASTAVGQVLEILKGMFDAVVVDTAGAFDDHALQAFDHSDLLVLVGTLDIPALKNLKLATGTLDLLNYPRDLWRLVVNRADARVGLSVEEAEKALGVSAALALPSSRDVLVAVNRGEPIVRAAPNHAASRLLAAFAATVSRDIALPGRTERRGGRRPLAWTRSRKVA
ncbi:MAG TPA: P-loop NTPase [Nocardioides sp.]|nr:P-loop NTPase [Nocardioides sp.]